MEYNQDYIQSLIDNKIEESLSLEYKSAGALVASDRAKKNISIDVSSFANSNGGIIIYGMLEDKNNKHLPSEIDPIDRNLISREWLEQIIDSRIHPNIEGIQIHPIEIDGDVSKVVYLVDIPHSNTAHQANDKKYHKRNFKSDIMEDYEIRDTMNRSKTPIIELEFEVERTTTHVPLNPTEIGAFAKTRPVDHYYLKVIAQNSGKVFSNYINALISLPKKCINKLYISSDQKGTVRYFADNTIREIMGHDSFGPSRYDPILPGLSFNLNSNIPELHKDYYDYENEVSWEVYADNAEPRIGKIRFRDIKTRTVRYD